MDFNSEKSVKEYTKDATKGYSWNIRNPMIQGSINRYATGW